MNPFIPKKSALPLLLAILTCFGLLPGVRAVSPPPDGGYPNQNTAEGDNALLNLTTGANNTALGFNSLSNETTGMQNTATGSLALSSNTTGNNNTAVGFQALLNNTDRSDNTAIGAYALFHNTFGDVNTAIGKEALYSNTSGGSNTAIGWQALFTNSTGYNNTAIGASALAINLTGTNNTACGGNALHSNSSGQNNTATGSLALLSNTTGTANTAIGFNALRSSTTAINNTANGANALSNNTTGNGNVAEGAGALQNNGGSNNTALGFNAGANLTTGSNNIDIGNVGVAGESSTIRIGSFQIRTFIGGIRGRTTGMANAIPVLIDSAGQLGTMSSSHWFKKEIKPMDKASEAILALKPVTFHYKSDKTDTPQFGLIAEEVAEVNPDLVVRDENGEVYTVRYDAVNAMLLNEFLKGHRKNEEQQATIARLEKQIEALTAGLEKMSARLELSKPAPRTALSDH